jgi:hypothetical protein
MYPNRSLPFRIFKHNFVSFSYLLHACYMSTSHLNKTCRTMEQVYI